MYSEQTARELDKEIETIIQSEYIKAKDIIKKHRKELDLIVETLMLLETIVKEQIDYIHENLKLPPEAIEAKKANEKNSKNKSDDSSKSQIDDSIKPIDAAEKRSSTSTLSGSVPLSLIVHDFILGRNSATIICFSSSLNFSTYCSLN